VTRDRTISILFMIGSACFALGAVPGYAGAVGVPADGVTFFVGSVFFTTAALGLFLQSDRAGGRQRRDRDWWAAAVQLAGTLFFNVSTLLALAASLSTAQQDRLVWRPDAYGSACFLVSSALSLTTVPGGWRSWRPHDRPWWIAVLNMTGSVAFGASAVASYVVPDSGVPRNAALVNIGTFTGALCFLLGAYLLLPRHDPVSAW
jgi:uncharacterized membrane protein YhaH (DUF805 family)